MKRSLEAVVGLFLAGLMLIVFAFGYSTTKGYTTWWFTVPRASVTVDGVPAGYLHRNSRHLGVMITRTDSSPPQSYLVGMSNHLVQPCGNWHAPYFVAFPIGDVSPPCWFLTEEERATSDDANPSTVVVTSQRMEFYTIRGKKIIASW